MCLRYYLYNGTCDLWPPVIYDLNYWNQWVVVKHRLHCTTSFFHQPSVFLSSWFARKVQKYEIWKSSNNNTVTHKRFKLTRNRELKQEWRDFIKVVSKMTKVKLVSMEMKVCTNWPILDDISVYNCWSYGIIHIKIHVHACIEKLILDGTKQMLPYCPELNQVRHFCWTI